MNKKTFTILFCLVCVFMPFSVFAQGTTEQIRNFISVSPDNPFLPILLLIGVIFAVLTFLFPRFGLLAMLFFMLVSTDMQLDQSTQGRAASIRLEDIILILVSGGWLLNRAKNRSLTMFRYVPINKPVLIMALVIVLASMLGFLQGTLPFRRGLLFTLKRLEYFWLFFMTLNIMQSDKEVKFATTLLLWLTALVSIVGAMQFYLFPLSGLAGGGATSTSGFGRANTLADFYLIAGGVFMGLIIYAQTRRKAITYLLVMSLCAIAIIMTKSRGAYVSIPPLVATIVFFSKSRKTVLYLVVGLIVFSVYMLGMMVLSVSRGELAMGAEILTQKHTGDIGNQFESLGDIATQGAEADSSFNARYSSWINNIDNIIAYPLLGHGVGSVPLSYFDCQHVREMYETGILGYLVFLYMNISIFMTTLTLFYMTKDPFTKGITCGFLGGHVGMMVHGWSIANFYTIMNMEVFWFVIALIMILYHNHITREQEKGNEELLSEPVQLEMGL
jgi:O-antigen ligase/polysaccharide polymerase Wzy-like membrane protein